MAKFMNEIELDNIRNEMKWKEYVTAYLLKKSPNEFVNVLFSGILISLGTNILSAVATRSSDKCFFIPGMFFVASAISLFVFSTWRNQAKDKYEHYLNQEVSLEKLISKLKELCVWESSLKKLISKLKELCARKSPDNNSVGKDKEQPFGERLIYSLVLVIIFFISALVTLFLFYYQTKPISNECLCSCSRVEPRQSENTQPDNNREAQSYKPFLLHPANEVSFVDFSLYQTPYYSTYRHELIKKPAPCDKSISCCPEE